MASGVGLHMSKGRAELIREYAKNHAFQLLLGSVLGLLGTLLSLCWPDGTPGLIRACVAFISFLLFGLLGVITGEIVALVGQQDILRQLNESVDLMRRQNALITDASKCVQQVLIQYSKTFWSEITTEPLQMPIKHYLWILEASLSVATKHVFATSLIAPDTWLADLNYTRYLDYQGERIRAERDLVIQRVFIMTKRSFYKNVKTRTVIQMHLDKGIKIGFCDSDSLHLEERVDLVIFEANGDRWAVKCDALSPNQPSDDEKNFIKVGIFYRAYSPNELFAQLKHDIDNYTVYFSDLKAFDAKHTEELDGSDDS